MKQLIIFLIIFGLSLETKPNIFKHFFYTKQTEYLKKGNYIVLHHELDNNNRKKDDDDNNSINTDKKKTVKLFYYAIEEGTVCQDPQELLKERNSANSYYLLIKGNTYEIEPTGFYAIGDNTNEIQTNESHEYRVYWPIKAIRVKLNLLTNKIPNAEKKLYIHDAATDKDGLTQSNKRDNSRTIYKITEDFSIKTEAVLNKTRAALTVFNACLIGYIAYDILKEFKR